MINITHEERLQFLKAHNDIKNMLQTMYECNDVWLSDLGRLEEIQCLLHRVMKFTQSLDEHGNRRYYADYVLEETTDDD